MKAKIVYILSLLLVLLVVQPLNAQRRYNNRKRVKVHTVKPEKINAGFRSEPSGPLPVTEIPEAERSSFDISVVDNEGQEPVVADVSGNKHRHSVKNNHRTADINLQTDFVKLVAQNRLLQKLTTHYRLHKSDVMDSPEQTMMAGWLKIMIILYAVGLIFLILGVIFQYTVSWPVALVMYILFALCWLAATIVLVLGLVGVI